MACRCSSAGAAGCACVVDVADTASVDLTATGTGDAATPRVISGVVKVSGAAGNTVVVNPDGLFVPVPPATPPAVGCGLSVVGSQVNLDTFPFAALTRLACNDTSSPMAAVPFDPACELEGQEVYCDSAGNLRTKPEKHTISGSSSISEVYAPGITAIPFTSGEVALSISNPSDCYCACGWAQFAFIPAISSAPGTVIFVAHEVDLGDGAFVPVTGFVLDQRGKSATSGGIRRQELHLPVCLDPGETKLLRHRVRFTRFTGDNGGAVLITSVAEEIRYFGSNV